MQQVGLRRDEVNPLTDANEVYVTRKNTGTVHSTKWLKRTALWARAAWLNALSAACVVGTLGMAASTMAQSRFGLERLNGAMLGPIPVLVVFNEYSDIPMSDPGAVRSMVEGPAGLADYVTRMSRGNLVPEVKIVIVRHGESFRDVSRMGGEAYRALYAERGLRRMLARETAWFRSLDRDGDGTVGDLELVVLTLNAGDERGGQYGRAAPFSIDGVSFPSLGVAPMGDANGLSTMAHELLHHFGAQDIYGPGAELNHRVSVMAAGLSDRTARVMPDAWHRIQFGWEAPQLIDVADVDPCTPDRTVQLDNPAFADVDNPNWSLVLYDSSRSFREYFVVEHRTAVCISRADCDSYPDNATLPRQGVVVWHVQTDSSGALRKIRQSSDDPAGRIDWPPHSTDGDVFGALAVAAGGKLGRGELILNSARGIPTLRWFDGEPTPFELTLLRSQPESSTVRVELINRRPICPRPPFSDYNPTPKLDLPPMPDPGPWKPQLELEMPAFKAPVVQPWLFHK